MAEKSRFISPKALSKTYVITVTDHAIDVAWGGVYRSHNDIAQTLSFDRTKQKIECSYVCNVGSSSAWCVFFPTSVGVDVWLCRGTSETTSGTLYITVSNI